MTANQQASGSLVGSSEDQYRAAKALTAQQQQEEIQNQRERETGASNTYKRTGEMKGSIASNVAQMPRASLTAVSQGHSISMDEPNSIAVNYPLSQSSRPTQKGPEPGERLDGRTPPQPVRHPSPFTPEEP